MDYIQQNKLAWEESYDNRHESWGHNIEEMLNNEEYAFFYDDMATVLRQYDLSNKTVGHFCCNNGRELLSLVKTSKAKKGYGFDIAENQIVFANKTANSLNINCEFIAKNILDINDQFDGLFDMMIITIGALCWFKELDQFFQVVARTLKSNGKLIINETHPVTNMLTHEDEEEHIPEYPANLTFPYFFKEWSSNSGMFYMTNKTYQSKTFTDFSHSLSTIINSILASGFTINQFTEYDYDISGMFNHLSQKDIPLSYILEATKN